ncbi:MAG TPA: molybdopterin-dependent oxidoreductase, partial [Thermoanaerobacterales bacterium]|nr:molybdopterin-dependent oxidoreductase [Thermoanaerobacterales bacterium]
LHQKPGTDVALINGLIHVMIKEELYDKKFVEERTENFDIMASIIEDYSPERVEQITGVPSEDIIKAARLFATKDKGAIYYAMGITQHSNGTDNVLALANLAMITGNVGKESTGVNPLRGQNNVQGACDMGDLPNVYTGYQPVNNPDARQKFEKAWKVNLPEKPGLTAVEMFNEAGKQIKALYILGENPVISDPDQNHVIEALKSLDFLVVQDIFLTETAQYADVVLPGVSFAEKDGTFTNTERRVQLVRKAVTPRGNARDDWQIICDLARHLGYDDMKYNTPSEIMDEIAKLTPSYGGIHYNRLEKSSLQWPCTDDTHPGTKYLHAGKFARGLGKFHPLTHRPPQEEPDKEYEFLLMTGRMLYHYHSGTMTRRSKALHEHKPDAYVEINLEDAKRLGIKEKDRVKVSSRRGEVETYAIVGERVRPGQLFMPFHYAESPANRLTNAEALDPVAKIPEYKVSAVKLEKIS